MVEQKLHGIDIELFLFPAYPLPGVSCRTSVREPLASETLNLDSPCLPATPLHKRARHAGTYNLVDRGHHHTGQGIGRPGAIQLDIVDRGHRHARTGDGNGREEGAAVGDAIAEVLDEGDAGRREDFGHLGERERQGHRVRAA